RYTRSFNYGDKSVVKSKEDLPVLGIKTFFCSNVCAAYRRELYAALGGFEKHTIFNEDMIMAGKMIKSGREIAYVAEAMVYHSHNYGNMMQFKRNFDLAVSQADHPQIFSMASSESEGMRMVKQT
ncbi:glycosyltransferase family 2 protein, partial [Enterobacter sichuanensis]|nr:glycosyltransferase family 2 protein [Enterobacter sichuanensis]